MTARFRVHGRFDRAQAAAATVEIDRAAGLFGVRPLRSRKTYRLPLATVAEIVVARICKLEAEEARAARKGR